MQKKDLILVALFIGILSLAVAGHYTFAKTGPAPDFLGDPKGFKTYWQERIDALGGEAAYPLLLKTYASTTPYAQHRIAHTFSGLVYEKEGAKAISMCDDSFGYGCFHEFAIRIIGARGISALQELEAACPVGSSAEISCWSGIGNGIQEYVGFGKGSLEKAFDICAALNFDSELAKESCYSGAVIHYGKYAVSIPKLPEGQLVDVCKEVSEKYATLCYRGLPIWLLYSQPDQVDTQFKDMGALCESLLTESHIRACFEGIGKYTAYHPARNYLCTIVSDNPTYQKICEERRQWMNSFIVKS